MRDYELVMVLSPEIGDEDVPAAIETINGFVADRGGEVAEVNRWGRRKLAYPIKKHTEGNYVVSQLKLDAQMAAELEASLRLSEQVIRHLLVRAED